MTMQLLVPPEIRSQLVDALTQAGRREVGGILMGEHIGPERFRVRDLTLQRKGGTFAAFVRLVEEILAPLRAFFDRTKHDYARFNYLGEWHSHHSFELTPSGRDHTTMQNMVIDPRLGANFVVLLLVKLNVRGQFECGLTVYQPHRGPSVGAVLQEEP